MTTLKCLQAFFACFLTAGAWLLITGCASAQPISDRSLPVIEINSPQGGERFTTLELQIEVELLIRDDSRLRSVIIEVTGESAATYFPICGDDAGRCVFDPPVSEFRFTVPVFSGWNTLNVFATDLAGNTGESSTSFYIFPPASEEPGLSIEWSKLPPVVVDDSPQWNPPPPAPRDRYDLLILTHSKRDQNGLLGFGKILEKLVYHKNSTGMPTILKTLEEIYEIPEMRGRDHAETIKNYLVWARKHWQIKYVMLVGDSDRFPIRYTRTYDLGHWGHNFAPSDLYYADLFDANGNPDDWDFDDDGLYGEMQGNFPAGAFDLNQDRLHLIPEVAIGRVPASTEQELNAYVEKIIQYETSADPGWFKHALLLTGDYPYSNNTNDAIGTILQGQSFQLTKLYHNQIWPSTTPNQRIDTINKVLNAGVGFVSYVGHGGGVEPPAKNGGVWGGWYNYYNIPGLANADRLPVIFSAACETGMFHFGKGPYLAKEGYEYRATAFPVVPPSPDAFAKYRWGPEPLEMMPTQYDVDALAEHFLVKNTAGAIAFIGAYTGTQGDSHTLARYFFEAYASGNVILGDAWNAAIREFVQSVIDHFQFPADRNSWYTAARYHHIHKMLLFGDPSLRLGGLLPDLTAVPDPKTGSYCVRKDVDLIVTVRNEGAGIAGPCTTTVDFGRYGQVSRPTPPLAPGQSATISFPIPRGCFDSDCEFRIQVDSQQAVSESDEANNKVQDRCIG